MESIRHGPDGRIIQIKKDDRPDNLMRLIIKSMLREQHMTLAELVRRYNILHPDTPTTPQNLSNKLSRDSLRFREFLDIIELCGYSISFSPIDEKNSADMPMTETAKETIAYSLPKENKSPIRKVNPDENEIPVKKTSFADLASLGYAVVDSPNFGAIVIAGELADNAAEFIRKNLDDNMTEIQEIILCNAANREYKVMAKPLDDATRKHFVF